MPWKATCPMEERMRFVVYYLEHEWPVAALCREFGISRKTGYKWISRYLEDPEVGLDERSRAPHRHPQAVSDEVEQAVCGVAGMNELGLGRVTSPVAVGQERLEPVRVLRGWFDNRVRAALRHGFQLGDIAGILGRQIDIVELC